MILCLDWCCQVYGDGSPCPSLQSPALQRAGPHFLATLLVVGSGFRWTTVAGESGFEGRWHPYISKAGFRMLTPAAQLPHRSPELSLESSLERAGCPAYIGPLSPLWPLRPLLPQAILHLTLLT